MFWKKNVVVTGGSCQWWTLTLCWLSALDGFLKKELWKMCTLQIVSGLWWVILQSHQTPNLFMFVFLYYLSEVHEREISKDKWASSKLAKYPLKNISQILFKICFANIKGKYIFWFQGSARSWEWIKDASSDRIHQISSSTSKSLFPN